MKKKVGVWKILAFLILLILLIAASYFLYINISDIISEPVQFIKNKTAERNQSSFSGSSQFYLDTRFADKSISYHIDEECSEEKKTRMLQAFSEIERETSLLKFYQAEIADILVSCYEAEDEETSGEYFIAGEGGATEIINTSLFYIIDKGKILLLYKTSLCDNYDVELHELLHVLGFKHSDNKESVMYSTTLCNQVLTIDIINELKRLYSIPELPDLYFKEVSAIKQGIYLDLNVEIGNQGLANSEDIKLELHAEGEKFDEFNISEINYGEGKFLEVRNIRLPSRKTKQIKFLLVDGDELDSKNNIAELFLPSQD